MSHLLSLSALHAAAPGVLDIVFGADGDFEGAPRFTGPIAYDVRSGAYPDLRLYRHLHLGFGLGPDVCLVGDDDNVPRSRCALDCRVPSVAARLAGLCARVPFTAEDGGVTRMARQSVLNQVMREVAIGNMCTGTVKAIVSLTLALAPRIASLQ